MRGAPSDSCNRNEKARGVCFPCGPDKLVSMMPFCWCFARRVNFFFRITRTYSMLRTLQALRRRCTQ